MKNPSEPAMYIGPPAKPMPAEISRAIGAAIGKFHEIHEAHLPMVYAKGRIDPPAQVLVLVMEKQTPGLLPKVMQSIQPVIPAGSHLDAFEFPTTHPMLATIRSTGTQLDLRRTVN
jgi:hypothetical protein